MNVEYGRTKVENLKDTFPWLDDYKTYKDKILNIRNLKDLQNFIEEITVQNFHEAKYKTFLITLAKMQNEFAVENKEAFVSYLRLFAYLILYCSIVGYNGALKLYETLVMPSNPEVVAGKRYPKQAFSPNYILGELLENLVDKLFIKEEVLEKALHVLSSGNYTQDELKELQYEVCAFPKRVRDTNGDIKTVYIQVRLGDNDRNTDRSNKPDNKRTNEELSIILPSFEGSDDITFPEHDSLRNLRELVHDLLGNGEERLPPSRYLHLEPSKLLLLVKSVSYDGFLEGVDFELLFKGSEA